jgi:hypothetical protein
MSIPGISSGSAWSPQRAWPPQGSVLVSGAARDSSVEGKEKQLTASPIKVCLALTLGQILMVCGLSHFI